MVWELRFRRAAFDWEITQLIEFLNRLQEAWVNLGEQDRRVQRNGSEGVFSVQSSYDFVAGGREEIGPWKEIWYSAVPQKVQFFMWTTTLNKISTMNMLQRRGFILPSVCLLCYEEA